MPKTTDALPDIVEAWFQQHFGHITPGTPDHAIARAAQADLLARLTPAAPDMTAASSLNIEPTA